MIDSKNLQSICKADQQVLKSIEKYYNKRDFKVLIYPISAFIALILILYEFYGNNSIVHSSINLEGKNQEYYTSNSNIQFQKNSNHFAKFNPKTFNFDITPYIVEPTRKVILSSLFNSETQEVTTNNNKDISACGTDFLSLEFPYICISGVVKLVAWIGVYDPTIDFMTSGVTAVALVLYATDVLYQLPPEISQLSELLIIAAYTSLKGSIPSEIGLLTNMNTFAIDQNKLKGEIPSQFGLLTSLQLLVFSHSHLEKTIPSELSRLTLLRELHFMTNSFTGNLPSEFAALTLLTVLQIYSNSLSGPIPSQLCLLSNLRAFHGSSNAFTSSVPSQLGRLSMLESFSFYDNLFTGEIPSELGSLIRIEFINLKRNSIRGTLPTELGVLTTLTDLYLSNNQISGTIPSILGLNTNLFGLELDENKLTGTLPSQLANLKKLHSLYLYDNYLSGSIPIEFNTFSQNFTIFCDYSGLISSLCAIRSIPQPAVEFLSPIIFIFVVCLICLLMIIIIISGILIFKYRATEVIRVSNYIFGIISVCGELILSSSVIPFGVTLIDVDIELRDIACIAYPHFLTHGLVIVLSCVIARCYPIWRLFNNRELKQITIKSSDLAKAVFCAALISAGIVTPTTMDSRANKETFGCYNTRDTSILIPLLGLYVILLALIACILGFKIRNVPEKFNNTHDIAKATYTLLTFGVGMSLLGLISKSATTLFLGIFLAVLVSVGTFTIFVHIKKIHHAIFAEKDIAVRPPRSYRSPIYFMPTTKTTPDLVEL